MIWNWKPLSLKYWHFKASEDIMTKFRSQAPNIIKIKYWNAGGSGNPPSLIPALQKISILGLKIGLWQWYNGISVAWWPVGKVRFFLLIIRYSSYLRKWYRNLSLICQKRTNRKLDIITQWKWSLCKVAFDITTLLWCRQVLFYCFILKSRWEFRDL